MEESIYTNDFTCHNFTSNNELNPFQKTNLQIDKYHFMSMIAIEYRWIIWHSLRMEVALFIQARYKEEKEWEKTRYEIGT